jgi:hypothetical protein
VLQIRAKNKTKTERKEKRFSYKFILESNNIKIIILQTHLINVFERKEELGVRARLKKVMYTIVGLF